MTLKMEKIDAGGKSDARGDDKLTYFVKGAYVCYRIASLVHDMLRWP